MIRKNDQRTLISHKKCPTTNRVFPNAHSTQPRSGPKVRTGVRISNGRRPSNLWDSFRALNRNSFSGIEGEGGLMVISCKGGGGKKGGSDAISLFGFFISTINFSNGSPPHSQHPSVPRQRLQYQQLPSGVQRCTIGDQGGRV